jgi:hypothetical protein
VALICFLLFFCRKRKSQPSKKEQEYQFPNNHDNTTYLDSNPVYEKDSVTPESSPEMVGARFGNGDGNKGSFGRGEMSEGNHQISELP